MERRRCLILLLAVAFLVVFAAGGLAQEGSQKTVTRFADLPPVVCAKPVWRCSGEALHQGGTIVKGSVQGIDLTGNGQVDMIRAEFSTDRNGNGVPERTTKQTKGTTGAPSVTLIMEDRNEDGFAEKQTLIEVHDLNENLRLDDQDLKTIERWEDKNGDREFDASEKTISSKGGTDLFIPEDEEIIVSDADGLSDDATASLDSGDPLTAAIAEYLGGSLYAVAMHMLDAGLCLARAAYHMDEVIRTEPIKRSMEIEGTTEPLERSMEIVTLNLKSEESIEVAFGASPSLWVVPVALDPADDLISWKTGRALPEGGLFLAPGRTVSSDIALATPDFFGLSPGSFFVLKLNDDVPYPATIPGVSELEYFFGFCLPGFEEYPWCSPVFDGQDCVPNAFLSLACAAEGSWRFVFNYAESGQMQTIPLPEENLLVEDEWLIMMIPSELFGESPGVISWRAGTYCNGYGDIFPNKGAGSFELEFE